MWIGVALPQAALHFGYHLATFSKYSNEVVRSADGTNDGDSSSLPNLPSTKNPRKEVGLIVLFCVSTLLVIVVPIVAYPTWVHITYTAVLGFAGAYTRYWLSQLNLLYPKFPVGTFIANITGTWLLAMFTVISKFSVDYYDTSLQYLLYGLSVGFCGCLTTISTFVLEIDTLPLWDSYRYGITTSFVAQFGIILIYNVYAYTSVPRSLVYPSTVNICAASTTLCHSILQKINCPSAAAVINTGCSDSTDYQSYQGICECGNFTINRVSQLVVDSQVKRVIFGRLLPAWPKQPSKFVDPSQTVDYCLSYQVSTTYAA
jgi:fluoride ion exporter CrcB/FEX